MTPNYPPTPCELMASMVSLAGRREPSQAGYEYAKQTLCRCLLDESTGGSRCRESESTHVVVWIEMRWAWQFTGWERFAGRDAIIHARTRDGSRVIEGNLATIQPAPMGWNFSYCEGLRMPAPRNGWASTRGRRPKASREGSREW